LLVTLRDAGDYIANLPKKESGLPEWLTTIEALMLAVDRDGPTMLARIGRHAGVESRPRSRVQVTAPASRRRWGRLNEMRPNVLRLPGHQHGDVRPKFNRRQSI
jgi:hypothetical protein